MFHRQPSRAQSRKFQLERLEARTCLAGEVFVEVVDGDLRISGDGLDNSIRIDMVASGQYEVRGVSTAGGALTTVRFGNNVGLFQTVTGVTDDIEIDLQEGRDVCSFGNIYNGGRVVWVPDDLTIRTGGGDDLVAIYGVSVGDDTLVELGSGDDHLNVALMYAGTKPDTLDHDFVIRAGSGADDVHFYESTTVRDELQIEMGSDDQDQTVALRDTTANDLTIEMGDGDDLVSLFRTLVQDDLSIESYDGDDRQILVQVTVRDDLTIETGDDQDTVDIRDSSADEVFARLGSGDDLLLVSRFRSRRADWDGQGNKDEMRFSGVLVSEYQEIDSFELGSIRI